MTDNNVLPQTEDTDRTGWNKFSPEVCWFLYDFFRYELSRYEKIIFYGYYITGLSLEDLSDKTYNRKQEAFLEQLQDGETVEDINSIHATFQYIGLLTKDMERRLRDRWVNRETWRIDDC